MNPIAKDSAFAPLLGALKRIQFSLESASPPCVMLAAPTMEEFNAQQLPPHCKVIRRKLHGKRVRMRSRNIYSPSFIARWPLDKLVEGISPTMLIVLSGHADIQIVDYMVHCYGGDVLFLPAGVPKSEGSRVHYEKVTPESYCDLLVIDFLSVGLHNLEVSICHSRGDQHTASKIGERCWVASRELSLIFDTLSEIAQHGRSIESAFFLFAAAISLLKQNIELGKCFTLQDFPSQSSSMDDYSPISKAQEYIQNHLYTSLSINLVARWVGLSRNILPSSFARKPASHSMSFSPDSGWSRQKYFYVRATCPSKLLAVASGCHRGNYAISFMIITSALRENSVKTKEKFMFDALGAILMLCLVVKWV